MKNSSLFLANGRIEEEELLMRQKKRRASDEAKSFFR